MIAVEITPYEYTFTPNCDYSSPAVLTIQQLMAANVLATVE